jgi:hypothetical protein
MSAPQPIINGTLLPQLQEITYDFGPATGYLVRSQYEGASQTAMLALQQDEVRGGVACALTYHRGGKVSLGVNDSTLQYAIDVWEIVDNKENPSGFAHPSVLSILNAYDNPTAIIAALKDILATNADYDATTNAALLALSDDDFNTLGDFEVLAQQGQGEYRKQQYVLRHTTNVSNRWAVNVADFGIDEIYSTAQLLSEVQNTSLWILPLPGRLVFKLNAIPVPPAVAGYERGWLKDGSTETSAANNRVNIVTEYSLDQWPFTYYAAYAG